MRDMTNIETCVQFVIITKGMKSPDAGHNFLITGNRICKTPGKPAILIRFRL